MVLASELDLSIPKLYQLALGIIPCNHVIHMYPKENKDIQFYRRSATGYQVILLSSPRLAESLLRCSEASPKRLLKPVRERTIYRALHTVLEYRYGSPYSYPAANEAEARNQAVQWESIPVRAYGQTYQAIGCRREVCPRALLFLAATEGASSSRVPRPSDS